MTKFFLIVGATARNGARWARQHIYVLLVLTPLVIGITLWSAARLATNAPPWPSSFRFNFALAFVAEICLILYGMSRALAEIYHVRRPESYFDSLSVDANTHLHAALANRIMRISLVGATAAILPHLIVAWSARANPLVFISLALFVLLTALMQMLAALVWINITGLEDARARFAVLVLTTVYVLCGAAIAAVLLLTTLAPPALAARVGEFSQWFVPVAALYAAALYVSVRLAHASWRRSDIERAQRLDLTKRTARLQFRFVENRFNQRVGAQLIRDLRLTLRSFSSIVYPIIGLAALWIIALVTAFVTDLLPAPTVVRDVSEWFATTWLPSFVAVKFACVLACVTLVMLLPAIINYELPHLGLERAAGIRGEQMWEAKLWYTRIVTLPAPLAAWFAGVTSGTLALAHVPVLLVECLWLWWMITLLAATLAFEIPDRFGLAVILILTLCLGVGLFTALFWPFGLIVLVFGVPQLSARGRARARYFLVAEES